VFAAVIVATACWYFGADVAHSILFGAAAAIGFAAVYGSSDHVLESTSWRVGEELSRHGTRSDVALLSGSVRGKFGRVNESVLVRARRIASRRLAPHHVDLSDPADRASIEELIGAGAYKTLTWSTGRRPTTRAIVGCLDALDRLEATPPEPRALRSRRPTTSSDHSPTRRTRGQ
jgi:hypothetical protein